MAAIDSESSFESIDRNLSGVRRDRRVRMGWARRRRRAESLSPLAGRRLPARGVSVGGKIGWFFAR